MILEIITPTKVIFKGEVNSISLPGVAGAFNILEHHAPIIAALKKGIIRYSVSGVEDSFEINDGFVEVSNNEVVICVE